MSIQLYRSEMLLIQHLIPYIKESAKISITGDIPFFCVESNNKDNYIQKVFMMDNTQLDIICPANGKLYLVGKVFLDCVKEEVPDYSTKHLINLIWLNGVQPIKCDVKIGEKNYSNRVELFNYLFKQYLISCNAKCIQLHYLSNNRLYRVSYFIDGTVLSEYFIKDINSVTIRLYKDTLADLEQLKGGVNYIGVSLNLETPSPEGYVKQLDSIHYPRLKIKL